MKKNGFTLAELLAVIVIMALLLTIAVPSVIGISNKIKTNMFCSKVEDIISAAKLYGEDNLDAITNASNYIDITVYKLIENNVFKKEDNDCDKNGARKCVLDPRDGSPLDNKKIRLSIVNKRVRAVFDPEKSTDYETVCKKS